MTSKPNNLAAFLVAISGGLAYEITVAIASGIILEKPWSEECDFYRGLIASSILFGGCLGCFFGGFFSDAFGPKKTLTFSSLIVILSAVVLSVQKNIIVLWITRAFSGLGVGCISAIAPVYVSEQSSPQKRGIFVSFHQLCKVLGIVFGYVLNLLFSSVTDGWRYEFLLTAVSPTVQIILLCFLPESQGWLEKELQKKTGTKTTSDKKTSFFSLVTTPAYRTHFLVSCILSCTVQLTGINAVLSYSPVILKSFGFGTHVQALTLTILCGVWRLLVSGGSLFLVGRTGRRTMLLAGYVAMGAGLALVVLSRFVMQQNYYYISLPGLMIFILGFEIGPGPVFILVISELFPPSIHGRAMSVVIFLNWISSIAVGVLFLPSVKRFGESAVFSLLCAMCVFAVVFASVCVPETKGAEQEVQGKAKKTDGPSQKKKRQ